MAEYKNVENIKQLFDEEFKKTRKLIQKGETHLDNLAEGFLEADRVIFRLPTADVVEVVRCKDCKWCKLCYPAKAIGEEAIDGYYCNAFKQYRLPDNYCSYGELKEREGKCYHE